MWPGPIPECPPQTPPSLAVSVTQDGPAWPVELARWREEVFLVMAAKLS